MVVFGAAGGLGAGLSRHCAEAGAKLALVDIDQGQLEALGHALKDADVDALVIPADVVKAGHVDRVLEAVDRAYGHVDLVVNTVGVTTLGTAWEFGLQDWDWVFAVNLRGALNITRTFVPALDRSGDGHLVHTSSTTAVAPGRPGCAPYMASKHALMGLCEGFQQDLRVRGSAVKVSVFIPGTVRSRIADSERHRHPEFGAPSTRPDDVAALQAHLDAQGLDGYAAAADLLAGIRAGQFYIFARNVDTSIVEARARAIIDGHLPPPHVQR